MKPILKFFSSLELTIGSLAIAMVLIFFGTLDQANLGIHGATEKYFHTIFVYHHIQSVDINIPYLPGGYLVGFTLLINLIVVAIQRFKFTIKKFGIWMTHIGIILLLIGEFVSSVFQEEANMTIDEGQTVNYTQSFRETELVVIDTSGEKTDRVYAIPDIMLERRQQISIDELPFSISVEEYMPNSTLSRQANATSANTKRASKGAGTQLVASSIPQTGKMNERNIPSTLVTLFENDPTKKNPEVLGTWLVREFMPPQIISYQEKEYTIEIRRKREYVSYEITLVDFKHERYLGTNIPKNFESDIIVRDSETGVERAFQIYMNNPLRYESLTFYQQSFMNDDRTTVLQVVRNPGRHLPYISCALVSLGLLWQFSISLVSFIERRKKHA